MSAQSECVSMGKLREEHPFWPSSQCVSIGKLLYLDVGPLGLQALDTGEDLLLVTRQSHIHLNELTTEEDRAKRDLEKCQTAATTDSPFPQLCLFLLPFP